LAQQKTPQKITSAAFACYPIQGYGPDYVLTGTSKGQIIFWKAFDLSFVKVLNVHNSPVTSLFVSNNAIFSGDQNGNVVLWSAQQKTLNFNIQMM